MMFYHDVDGRKEKVEIVWRQHTFECERCRKVDLDKSATFVHSCAIGSQLLAEELRKAQQPKDRERAQAEEAWAEKAGTFKTAKDRVKNLSDIAKYK